jgi:hypothetical protein
MRRLQLISWIGAIVLGVGSCGGTTQPVPRQPSIPDATLAMTSSAFDPAANIPPEHSCDGQDISPPLAWLEPPAGTQSLVLIVDDPEAPAGTWTHWVLFDIPATVRSLPQAVPSSSTVEGAGTNGSNSWDRLGYGGPCPPRGPTHRYYFTLYTLDTTLGLDAGAGKAAVEQAMAGPS